MNRNSLKCLLSAVLCLLFYASESFSELKAFPTAEGYGRFSKGGRGGRVIKVTNLNDDGPGSLRDAVDQKGPRTVVFDISGVINLKSKLLITGTKGNSFLTIAGQTAPAKGIVIHGWTVGMIGGEHTIMRHIRTRVGTSSGNTMDGMGMASANTTIFDHCSISWTIDEAFSSRSAHNITLQRCLISEALNEAGHKKYSAGAQHGFAASIGGDIGSFHNNLLAHCAGRNWSLAGGLDKSLYYSGRLDIRNNVVYNWRGRTTDGGAHEVNFVNNYYKEGPAVQNHSILTAQLEGKGKGSQSYYYSGNVLESKSGSLTCDGTNNSCGRSYKLSNGQKLDWDVWVDKPFFESYVKTVSAKEAYKSVLADVGCNVPVLDDHDKRVIKETLEGTYTYKGSKTGYPGLIDNEKDCGGLEDYPVIKRPAGWDSDDDGMPDAWEKKHGLNPSDENDRNKTNLSKEGYTNLEMYLNELAGDPVDFTDQVAIGNELKNVELNTIDINGATGLVMITSGSSALVKVELFNVSGQRLGLLYEGMVNTGSLSLPLTRAEQAGVYFVRISNGNSYRNVPVTIVN